jgi:ferredoxin
MIATINPDTCIGCTLCTQSCSEIFKMEGDKAVVYKDPVPQEAQECARQAAEECPVQAIILN